jgi:AcrR family transcriptional regulator
MIDQGSADNKLTRGTRDQILDAAENLFGSRGYADVTIGQLCEASGLPVGSIYHHFGSKSGVLKAVLERGTTEIFKALPTAGDPTGFPLKRLAAYYATAADLIAKRLPLFRLMASLRLHHADSEDVQAILTEIDRRAIAWVVAFIEPVASSCGVRDAAGCARELAPLNLVFLTGLVASADSTGIDVRAGISRHLYRLIVASILDRAARSPCDC